MAGKDRVQTFFYNCLSKNINREEGRFVIFKGARINLHKTAKINLNGDFYVNSNKLKGSKAEAYFKMQENSVLNINGHFKLFYGATIQIFKNASLTLGKGFINTNSVISCSKCICIGDGAAIARGVHIYDGDHHAILDDKNNVTNMPEPIHIGNHVWIGVNAVILKGVTIGEGSIVAAGAVVTSDIPPRCLAAGVPAKVVRENVEWK